MSISDWSSDVCSSDLLLVQTDRLRSAGLGWPRSGASRGSGSVGLDESSLIVTGVMRPAAAAPSREENQCDRLESRGYSRRDRALHARSCPGSDTWKPDRQIGRAHV